ncbi:hypothetical protein ACFP2T_35740 [Plantactinospora solaniradicis]|uniref:Phage tail protein n=1 Tax=Plantactinospora solaniradicis TaxID=1723736 RepID=A0ABW1KIB4_9ACTN
MAITNYDPAEVRLAPDGRVLVAPVGTAEPVSVAATFDPAWAELGWVTEDGVTVTPSVDTNDVNMWQSITPVKRPLTGMGLEVSVPLGSFNRSTLGLYFLNSEWTTVGSNGRLEMPNAPVSQEVALAVEWEDDEGDLNRLIFPRATMTDRDALNLVRADAITLGLTFSTLAGPDGYSAVLLTNNPELAS